MFGDSYTYEQHSEQLQGYVNRCDLSLTYFLVIIDMEEALWYSGMGM